MRHLFLAILGFMVFFNEHSCGQSLHTNNRAVRARDYGGTVGKLATLQVNGTPIEARVDKCNSAKPDSCLYFKPAGEVERSIWISSQTLSTVEIGLMGFHFPGNFEAIYIYSYFNSKTDPHSPRSLLVVVDPNQSKLVANVDNVSMLDYNFFNTYFDVVKAPEDKGFPFLGPGMHYMNVPYWSFLCIFDASKIARPDTNCGTGFRSASISFTNKHGKNEAEDSGFRHNRGWLQDVDGDGWDDIHLPYFKYIVSLSGRTTKQLTLSLFDVAQYSEPNVQPFFHNGRYYGGYTMFVDPKTKDNMVLLTAGSTVGSFANWNCNVSRYTAAIRWHRTWITGKPYATLDWSHYASFSNTAFTWDYKSVDSYFRKGDEINKCIHRFADSMLTYSPEPVMAYSQFETTERYNCEKEMFEASKTKGSVEQNLMRACMEAGTKKTRGTWNIYAKNAVNGAPVNSMPRAYLWGRINNFIPGEGMLFIVEHYNSGDGKVRFDQEGHTPDALSVVKLSGGKSWTILSTLDAPPASPRVDQVECITSQAANQSSSPDASCGRPEFLVRDIDGDGLDDIQLMPKAGECPKWLGYSKASARLVLKSAACVQGKDVFASLAK